MLKITEEKHGVFFKVYRDIFLITERFEKHHVYLTAAGIAFNILLYLIPMILVALYIVGLIFEPDYLINTIQSILRDFLPDTQSTKNFIHSTILEVQNILNNSKLIGIIAIPVLLWISSFLISSLRTGLNSIFEIESPKIFLIYRVKDMILTVMLTLLILIYSYVIPIFQFIQNNITNIVPDFFGPFVSFLLLSALSLVSSFIMFYLIFRYVPNSKTPRYIRITSTISSVVLIEISRNLFSWYLSNVSNYGRFYGAYAIIVSMAIWIYYSSLIILISAELANYLYDRKHGFIDLSGMNI
jgi:membrane protein